MTLRRATLLSLVVAGCGGDRVCDRETCAAVCEAGTEALRAAAPEGAEVLSPYETARLDPLLAALNEPPKLVPGTELRVCHGESLCERGIAQGPDVVIEPGMYTVVGSVEVAPGPPRRVVASAFCGTTEPVISSVTLRHQDGPPREAVVARFEVVRSTEGVPRCVVLLSAESGMELATPFVWALPRAVQ